MKHVNTVTKGRTLPLRADSGSDKVKVPGSIRLSLLTPLEKESIQAYLDLSSLLSDKEPD